MMINEGPTTTRLCPVRGNAIRVCSREFRTSADLQKHGPYGEEILLTFAPHRPKIKNLIHTTLVVYHPNADADYKFAQQCMKRIKNFLLPDPHLHTSTRSSLLFLLGTMLLKKLFDNLMRLYQSIHLLESYINTKVLRQ